MGELHVGLKLKPGLLRRAEELAQKDHDGNLSAAMKRALAIGLDTLEGIGRVVREAGVEQEE